MAHRAENRNPLKPNPLGTAAVILAVITAWILGGEGTTESLHYQAIVLGVGISISALSDINFGLKNIIRVDFVCIIALYFLTFVEYLFPQPDLDLGQVYFDLTESPSMVLIGIAGLTLGRHIEFGKAQQRSLIGLDSGLSPKHLLSVFWISAALAYLYILFAVDFNLVRMLEEMMMPRFSQSWGRGMFGDWKALLYELALFLYVIPPLYGVMLGRRQDFSRVALFAATPVALLTMFYGFSGGTRNIFAAYLVTMAGGYLMVTPNLTLKHSALVGGITLALLYFASTQMLAFRQIGLTNYLKYDLYIAEPEEEEVFFVDANLVNLAMILEAFPERHDYLGLEVPYWAAIRPIPRAIWSGKPEGLSVGVEEAAGMEGLTLSITFVGESYMAGGRMAVVVCSLLIGAGCGMWNRRFRGRSDSFSTLVYASGFFPAAITMRSLFSLTTAILPVMGMMAIAWYLNRESGQQQARRTPRNIQNPKLIRNPSSPRTH